MKEFNNENLNIEDNIAEEGNTDELKFTNMSTRDYMNMMAERSNAGYGAEAGDYSYQNTYDNSTYGSSANNDYTAYYAGQTDSPNADYNNGQAGYDNQTTYYGEQVDNLGYYSQQPKKEKKHKAKKAKSGSGKGKKFVAKVAGLVAGAAVFGGVAGVFFNLVTDGKIDLFDDDRYEISDDDDRYDDDSASTAETLSIGSDYEISGTAVVTDGVQDSMSLDVSDIAENVMPSVVSITIKSVTEYNAGFFGQTYEYESEGSGSGIIIGENDEELLIVTNNHVVADADTVTVAFIDDQVYEAKVKGTDSDSDLAIIVVDLEDLSADTLSQIKIATIGNSDELKVGEQVVAIGNALGYGQSVTTGIVSAKDRTNDTNSTPLIQTDAAINPGNSGGALLNMKGEVIGINSSKMASYDVEGMGYAIPITEVESIIDSLMNRETREKVSESERGYLGIGCQTISEDASYMYGLPVGALVTEVQDKSAAERAGIKKNYIITKFDGQTVSSADGLVSMLEYYKAGETVEVVVMYPDDDEYLEKTISVTLGKKSE